MANYSFTVPTDRQYGIHKTLANTTEDVVTINNSNAPGYAQIVNTSTGPIYIDVNDTTLAAPRQDGSIVVPAGMPYNWYIGQGATVKVHLIGPSAGSWDYSAQVSPLSTV